jgi:hypothetical protein
MLVSFCVPMLRSRASFTPLSRFSVLAMSPAALRVIRSS